MAERRRSRSASSERRLNPSHCSSRRKRTQSSAPLFYGLENVGNRSAAWFRTEIAFTVNADADGVGVHVAFSDDKHRVHFHLFGALNFAVDVVAALVDLGANLMRAQLVKDRYRIFEHFRVIADWQDAHLFGRQ